MCRCSQHDVSEDEEVKGVPDRCKEGSDSGRSTTSNAKDSTESGEDKL
jgi:hypothetical protein